MCKGFLKIPRKVFSSDIWNEKRVYSRYEALIDLYQSADMKSHRVTVSFRSLADRWRWSLWKVQDLIKRLTNDGYITVEQVDKCTVITVDNTPDNTPNNTPYNTPKTRYTEGFREVCNTPGNTPHNTPDNTPRAYKNDNINIMSMEELKEEPPISPKGEKRDSSKFMKPEIEEVDSFVKEKQYHFDAVEFWNFYESKGWMIGKNKMKDWKAACVTWERSWKKRMSESLPLGFTLNDNSTTKYDNDKTERW